ncbi:hypothetical protein BKA24_001733 [Microbacterium marinum]|uniref:Uncharacterized protein n=1 Tax=Microbacterium marinum TaxID=421115 RepID=A0A7W7BST2_9MICO|nr:hypothetical protein [Microbacterium marinum]MBB4667024.1 hypothetical protein [Microbacterium marinum]
MTARQLEPKVNRGKTLDDTLIELSTAGLSRAEISRRIGGVLTPERVDERLNALLEAPDWLSDAKQERALLQLVRLNLMDLRADLDGYKESVLRGTDELSGPRRDAYNDNLKLQLAYIDRIFTRYDKRARATDEDLNTWSVNVGRELGSIVDEALAYMKGALRGEIAATEWDQLKIEAMQHAWSRIEEKQVERAA